MANRPLASGESCRGPFFFLRLLFCLAGAIAPAAPSLAAPPPTRFEVRPADRALLAALRQGGFVLFLVNAPGERAGQAAGGTFDVKDCATQRAVSPDGRRVAVAIGEAMRRAGIPVGELRIGPLCLVRETAVRAFPGMGYTVDPKLLHTPYLTEADKPPILANTRLLLSLPVLAGGNRLLIGQAPSLMDLIAYFPDEGTLVVFRPKGVKEGFEYVASIAAAAWPDVSR